MEALAAMDPAAGVPEGLAELASASWLRWTRLPMLPRDVLEPLNRRYEKAIAGLVAEFPQTFAATPLDPEANRAKMDALCARVERCLTGEAESVSGATTPTAVLADRLREALAANTMGGRPSSSPPAEDTRWRAAVEEVKDAQATWRRLGPVPGPDGRALTDRFQKACNRFFDLHRRRQGAHGPSAGGPADRPRR
jgi:hypothetical protein